MLFGRWLWSLSSNIDILFYSVQEQSKSESEKLIADMTSLISDHIRRQVHLVGFWRSFLIHYYIFLAFMDDCWDLLFFGCYLMVIGWSCR